MIRIEPFQHPQSHEKSSNLGFKQVTALNHMPTSGRLHLTRGPAPQPPQDHSNSGEFDHCTRNPVPNSLTFFRWNRFRFPIFLAYG